MSLSDTNFTALADIALARLAVSLESFDDDGLLDVELSNGVLVIELPSGKQFVVNRHAPSQQIWLSSPLSGGLRFEYDERSETWELRDRRRLDTLLLAEVETLLGEE